LLVLLGASPLLAACSTPSTGSDDYATGSQRVVQLVADAAQSAATGARVGQPLSGPVTCRRRFLGYAVGRAGTRKAESPLSIDLAEDAPVGPMLERIASQWRADGYDVDDSAIDDERFPKVRARVPGGYEVVATGLLAQHQLELYAVSGCLDG
jgi:hypothetical protein